MTGANRSKEQAGAPNAERLKLPGLYGMSELEQIVEVGYEYRFVDAGRGARGQRLFAVTRRPLEEAEKQEVMSP